MKYSITYNDKTCVVKKGLPVSDALFEMDAPLLTPCGGKGICGKCKITVQGDISSKTAAEDILVNQLLNERLACQTRIEGHVSVQSINDTGQIQLKYPEINPASVFGIAVDIGTTSVQVSLVNLSTKETFLLDTFLNPQRRFGHDVISRISAAADSEIFDKLVKIIRERIHFSIHLSLERLVLPVDKIKSLAISGNTTMLHFFFGLDVSTIALHPFKPYALDFEKYSDRQYFKEYYPGMEITGLPAISSFLGGDLLGGLLYCYEKGFTSNTYFIDIGTNGEMYFINSDGKIYGTSCAMGPALEGMNISCGMTAGEGAISHFHVNGNTLKYTMIGEGPPAGITGTAIIDLLSILLEKNIILPSGAFIKDDSDGQEMPLGVRFENKKNERHLLLSDTISISQKDIRNIQLAKGASLSAARLILKKAKTSIENVKNVFISGAFGKHLDMDHFKKLNFLPDFSNATYHLLGNTSLKAAEKTCYDPDFIERAVVLRKKTMELELASDPNFSKEMIHALNFN